MDFVYFYKTSDGAKRQGEISAPGVEDAYAALRQQGIHAIKVVPRGLTPEGAQAIKRRWIIGTVLGAMVVAIAAGAAFWTLGRWSVGATAYLRADGTTAEGANKDRAEPMARRQITGDKRKISEAIATGAKFIFQNPAEAFLARYAQPGRAVTPAARPADEDFIRSLKAPIYAFPDEIHEHVELKRIVAGMKEELKMFLASGGTVKDYVERLEQRQQMEADYRAKAVRELAAILAKGDAAASAAEWEKQNEWLIAMGIEELPLPAELTKE